MQIAGKTDITLKQLTMSESSNSAYKENIMDVNSGSEGSSKKSGRVERLGSSDKKSPTKRVSVDLAIRPSVSVHEQSDFKADSSLSLQDEENEGIPADLTDTLTLN